jgi:hypothetical protein
MRRLSRPSFVSRAMHLHPDRAQGRHNLVRTESHASVDMMKLIQLLARGNTASVRVVNKDGREQIIKP